MSVSALEAQLTLETKRGFVLFEGASEKRLLRDFVEVKKLAFDLYSTDDIDIELLDEFRIYGGNKGRVLSLFVKNPVAKYADASAFGFIDRDFDEVLARAPEVKGVYSTFYTSLLAAFLDRDSLSHWLKSAFGRRLTEGQLEEIYSFSSRMFRLKAVMQRDFNEFALPSITKSVRRLSDGGFNWDRYLHSVLGVLGHSIDSLELNARIDQIELPQDYRQALHVHNFLAFLHEFLRAERAFDNTVSLDELYRHLAIVYTNRRDECPVAQQLIVCAQRLVA